MGSLLRRATHSMARTGPVTSLGQCKAYMHIQMRSRHFWSEYMRRYSPQLKWKQVERSAWSPMIQGAILWRLTRRPWASIPLVRMRRGASPFSYRLSPLQWSAGHHRVPDVSASGHRSVTDTARRPSFQCVYILVQCGHGVVNALTVHRLSGMTCVPVIRTGDWFRDFEVNKG